jgi:hypothetical protein
MASETKYVVHYGGQRFITYNADVIEQLSGQEGLGTVKFRLDDNRWLEIATGPGIPIAVEEMKPDGIVRSIR